MVIDDDPDVVFVCEPMITGAGLSVNQSNCVEVAHTHRLVRAKINPGVFEKRAVLGPADDAAVTERDGQAKPSLDHRPQKKGRCNRVGIWIIVR
jgi:hypothetical protein